MIDVGINAVSRFNRDSETTGAGTSPMELHEWGKWMNMWNIGHEIGKNIPTCGHYFSGHMMKYVLIVN